MSTVGPVCQLNIPFSSSSFLPFPRVMRGNGYRLPRTAAVDLCVSETTTEPYFSHFLRRRSSLSLSLSPALRAREQAASGRPRRPEVVLEALLACAKQWRWACEATAEPSLAGPSTTPSPISLAPPLPSCCRRSSILLSSALENRRRAEGLRGGGNRRWRPVATSGRPRRRSLSCRPAAAPSSLIFPRACEAGDDGGDEAGSGGGSPCA